MLRIGKKTQEPAPEKHESIPRQPQKRELRDPYHLVGREVEVYVRDRDRNEKARLLQYAGGGGMGAVYLATSPLRGGIAIKILKPDIAEKYSDISDLFSREVRAAAELDHPNIVRFLGDGRMSEGYPFVAVEWLTGTTLDKYVTSALSIEHALALFGQIGSGLAHAHSRRIIHLDLKPENIFVVPEQDNSAVAKVKIIDFGLARVMTTYSGTTATRFAGTPQYCSPEHFGTIGKLSIRSDIFSLGLILYYMIAGVLPIGGSGIMAKQFGQPLPPLPPFRNLEQSVGDRIYDVIQKSIQLIPEDRFQSVTELLRALDEIASRVI